MSEVADTKIRLVAIKFRAAGRHYDFNAQMYDFAAGDRVVVETDRGRALGSVVIPPREIMAAEAPDDLKSILRPATDEDLALADNNTAREKEAFRFCKQRIQERKMEMKLVRAEYLFDGSKIVFYFTADGRVDFRELVKDLAHHFHTRIEMRQIGVRDEAKLTGGIGICGRELCCCTFLSEFAPVSVKMAKEQGLALNPTKISGQCGRLLCCLGYEFETYCAMKKGMPKCGKRVQVDGQELEVVEQKVLAQKVTVRLKDGKTAEVATQDLETRAASPAPETAATSPQPATPRQEQQPAGRRPQGQRPPRSKPGPRPEAVKTNAPPASAAPDAVAGEQPAAPEARKRRSRRRPRRK
ncbi:MAG: regulatory iron-sulfur-containing complex subunit RicT [Desulfuromonadales bacterium]|jgi:cell fate regulator YaaT (PSP1 superfamily)